MKKVLLIGGNGYIGSYLNYTFSNKFNISIIDIDWFSDHTQNSLDFKFLKKDYLSNFDSIIMLAGHSSVKMCQIDMMSSFKNNVHNFLELVEKLDDQKFIYASSSSVYGETDNKIVNEIYPAKPINFYDMSKNVIDTYMLKSNKNFYGLRFGTVNGWSPNLRTDVMINAMYDSAIVNNHIKLYIKEIMRPILGIKDLSSAIERILNHNESKPGIYNVASFNKTAEEIAFELSSILNKPIIEYDHKNLTVVTNAKLQTSTYDFAIDSCKFQNAYNFEFKETIASIVESLISNYNNCTKTKRDIPKYYDS